MSIFLTGATGYVGKHLLRSLLLLTDKQIRICIREKKGVSASDRFQKEIVEHGLFKGVEIGTRITIVKKEVGGLQSGDLSGCTDIIHCAANVKFNSPLDLLMKENVEALKILHALCKEKRFYHISTCYVHPTNTQGIYESKRIESGLEKSDFVCDYAYTKYLAEQYLYEQSGVIDIIRLSCVGAPIEDLAPMRGGAHLGILELLESSKLPDLWISENLQFSVVPVDVLCNGIIHRISRSHDGIEIVQYAAPATSKTYNISVNTITQQKTYSTKLWSGMPYAHFLAWMGIFYWFTPSILKRITDASDVISYVKTNQTFDSDIVLPELTPEEYTQKTLAYVSRLVKTKNTILDWFLYLFSHLKSFLVWMFDSLIEE
jgi:nucleoside-diphosphate-sugar epimerase